MAPPPKIVHSVVVTNAMSAAVNVQVAFDNHKEKIELLEEHRIEPGASWDFAEKTLDMGSWTAVAPVKKITVLQANGPAHVLEPEVSQIVKKLKVKVQDDGTLLQEGEA